VALDLPPAASPSGALLSVLGVPGWGPLHLLLKQRADPHQFAGRLRQALGIAGLPVCGRFLPPGRLLAALLRSDPDLDPVVKAPDQALMVGLRYRHRLVCRDGITLIIRSWMLDGTGCRWCSLGPGQRLDVFLRSPERWTGQTPLLAAGGPEPDLLRPDLLTTVPPGSGTLAFSWASRNLGDVGWLSTDCNQKM